MNSKDSPISDEYNAQTVDKIMREKKVSLFIVAYNAEKHIESTIKRIPKDIAGKFAEIFVIDDSSKDDTYGVAKKIFSELGYTNTSVMRTPTNQHYGGNQKIGYSYAIKKGYDIVIMLHGDGQYPPESLPKIIEGYQDPSVKAVFGSRMIYPREALKGGMPLYKWVGNQVLTFIENKVLKSKLSEFHSGYRSYSVPALNSLYFELNSNDFHFDTDIIIQFIDNNYKILEVPMSTHYGDEVCHVNGMKYFFDCIKSITKHRLHKMGIFYQPNFDIKAPLKRNYNFKKNPNTLHQYILNLPWSDKDTVADLGANDGTLANKIKDKVHSISAIDIDKPDVYEGVEAIGLDLNSDFDIALNRKFDKIIALDIIEHLYNPEMAMKKINNILKNDGYLYISTANIAYIIMRLTILFGWFNYGKKGILDKTHHRLFTINSFKRLVENSGFTIVKVAGFGPPIADELSNKGLFRVFDIVSGKFAKVMPKLFSFNYLVIAKKNTPLEELFKKTEMSKS